MSKYLLKVSYTQSGIGGVLKDGGKARVEVARKLIKSVGGKMLSFDFAFGGVDVYVIADLPSHAAAAKAAMTVSAAGGATIETVVLISPDEIDAAAKGSATTAPGA